MINHGNSQKEWHPWYTIICHYNIMICRCLSILSQCFKILCRFILASHWYLYCILKIWFYLKILYRWRSGNVCRLSWLEAYSHKSAYGQQEIYLNPIIMTSRTGTDLDGFSCIWASPYLGIALLTHILWKVLEKMHQTLPV